MRPFLLFACGMALCGQAPPPPESTPIPRQKARELLDASLETLSAASPAIQVAALLEIVPLYNEYDKAQTLKLLDQTFAIAGAVPPEASRNVSPANLQTRAVLAAAGVDPNKAIEMIPGLPVDRRGGAVERIALALLSAKETERAVRVVEENAGQGYPPLRAIDALLAALPAEHPQRASLFANAFMTVQLDSGAGYQDLIAKHWRSLPRQTVEPAANKLVNAILDQKDDGGASTITVAGSKGSARFESRADYQLFDLIQVLREFDPKRAAALLEARPGLAETVRNFPEGRASLKSGESDSLSTNMRTSGKGGQRDPAADARMQLDAIADVCSREILALAATDLQTAVSRVQEIPLEYVQVQTLTQIAMRASGQDPATARSVIGQAVTILKGVKDPQLNAHAWAAIADAARQTKDADLARQSIDKGLSVCAELYKLDTDADSPNIAEREHWPSVQHFRAILYRAGQIDGVTADTYLARMNDPDLVLMGRVEIAKSLLGKPRSGTSISVSRGKRR